MKLNRNRQVFHLILVLAVALAFSTFQAQAAPLSQDKNPLVSELALSQSISAGGMHSCRVMNNGTLFCWGDDGFNQVTDTPVGGTYTQVSAGGSHSCALKSDGTLVCWGDDSFNQVTDTPAVGTFIQVSAGGNHSCALKSNSTLACWGDDSFDQLTDMPVSGTFTQVSAGDNHTCARKSDGTLKCWGLNTSNQSKPPTGTFIQVSAGGKYTCGIRGNGTLACWGQNSSYQASPPSGTFSQIDAGWKHACGLRSDGTLACWGLDADGQATPPEGTFLQVSAGTAHTCAVKIDSSDICWGDNTYKQTARPIISGKAGVAGAVLHYTDGAAKTVVANSKGLYFIGVSHGWSGTVKPAKSGYIFSPTSRAYSNLSGNKASQNYTAYKLAVFYSIGAYDGLIRESGPATSKGGTLNTSDVSIYVGDDAANKQLRGILHFNTASLPDNAVIASVTLKVKQRGAIAGDPFGVLGAFSVDIRKPYFGTTHHLVISDFQAAASTGGSAIATFATPPGSGNWYTATITPFTNVNKYGSTQFRLRFAIGDNGDSIVDYLKIYSGNAPAAYRPKLYVKYRTP